MHGILLWRKASSGVWSHVIIGAAPAGSRSVTVEVADVDMDTDLDVIVRADGVASETAWYKNPSTSAYTGMWEKRVIGNQFTYPSEFRMADMDNDGDPDVVGVSDGNSMYWVANNKRGDSWTPNLIGSVAMYNKPGNLRYAIADVNRDGKLDIVVASDTSGGFWRSDLAWLENPGQSGSGWFARPIPAFWPLKGAVSVDTGDFDGDGTADLVAVNQMGTVAVLRNGGGTGMSWTLGKMTTTTGAALARVADVDRDGDPDILIAGGSLAAVTLCENTARTGSGWSMRAAGSAAYVIGQQIRDMDRDACLTS